METIDLGFALLLPQAIEEELRRLVAEIEKRAELAFVVDGEKLIFHMTLMQGRFPREAIAELKRMSGMLAAPLRVEMEEALYLRPNGNVFWNARKTDALKEAHALALEKFLPLTLGLRMPQFEKVLEDPNASTADKEQINRFGAVLAGERFLPHVTLGRLASRGARLDDVVPQPHTFLADTFVLGELDEFGQIHNVV